MLYNQAQALLKRAAGAVLERIAADRARSPWKVRPLLDHLGSNLFDPDLNVDQLKRACGVRDNSIAVAFHAAVGQPPGAYIAERRLETAATLLAETKLPVWQISDLVGYSSIQVFSRSFSRWAGKSPNSYRRRRANASAQSSRTTNQIDHSAEHVASAAPQAMLLRRHLDIERAEELEAEEVWLAIRHRPWEIQRAVAQQGLGFRSPALFECLLRKTRQEGRDNRERGIQVATLAIESLAALQAAVDPAQWSALAARGWAWLGNAHRLMLNFQDAEAAMRAAEKHLALAPGEPLANAEVLQNRGALCWYQRRYDDALEYEERAVELFREVGDADLLAQSLMLKAAIRETAGDLDAAIEILLEALALVEDRRDHFLTLSIYQWLVASYVQAGHHRDAVLLLPVVKSMALETKSHRVAAHMTWVEGRIEQTSDNLEAAEARFLEAHGAFEQLGDSFFAALVSFDLTTVYSLTRRFPEIIERASEMLKVFTASGFPHESLAALALLQRGINSQEMAQELLRKIRVDLEEIRQDPRRQLLRP